METTETLIPTLTYAQKIIRACSLEGEGKKKVWFADKLGISRVTLDKRLSDNFWKDEEIEILKTLLK